MKTPTIHFGIGFTAEKTQEVLEKAERIIARLERFLQERGFLDTSR